MPERRRKYTRCVCDWPHPREARRCSGTGVQYCKGCGGDLCVCICGGERDCDGCEACDPAVADVE